MTFVSLDSSNGTIQNAISFHADTFYPVIAGKIAACAAYYGQICFVHCGIVVVSVEYMYDYL